MNIQEEERIISFISIAQVAREEPICEKPYNGEPVPSTQRSPSRSGTFRIQNKESHASARAS